MKPGSIIFIQILRLKIRSGFHLRATDLSMRAVAKHQIACCMQYSLIWKVQSFKFQSQKVVLSMESFTEKVFLLNLLISIRNADRAPVSAASNYSMMTHRPIRYGTGIPERTWARCFRSFPIQPWPVPLWLLVVPKTKGKLAGHRFESRCGIGSAVYQCLQHIPKEDYRAAFWKWVDRCKMCVEADRAYFEGLR